MDLSIYKPASLSDSTWVSKYIVKMGERSFWGYKIQVYDKLRTLEVGEWLNIEKWCKPDNFDLYIKIACCFISESECCYQFNSTYTIIKHQFDKNETLDNRPKKIRLESYQRKTASSNSQGYR